MATLSLLLQIIVGGITVIASIYGAVTILLKWTKNALESDFVAINNQLELLKQNIVYTNQLLLEKIAHLEKEIDDIENWLDKQDDLTYVKRKR